MGHELQVGQAVRLKGRATAEDVGHITRLPAAEVQEALAALVAAGHAVEKGDRVRLTPEGKERVTALVEEERAALDHDRLEAIHARFLDVNAAFKQLASDWQQRDGEPNDHSDADYDAAVLARLDEVDARLRPILTELAEAFPRSAPYAARFAAALESVRGGDHKWFLHPLCDSYHTVWFELHEELIAVTGRTRAEEAAAGRGA
jgi:hypothetical protein